MSRNHWYDNLPPPEEVATTVKVALPPVGTTTSTGCCVMTGGYTVKGDGKGEKSFIACEYLQYKDTEGAYGL